MTNFRLIHRNNYYKNDQYLDSLQSYKRGQHAGNGTVGPAGAVRSSSRMGSVYGMHGLHVSNNLGGGGSLHPTGLGHHPHHHHNPHHHLMLRADGTSPSGSGGNSSSGTSGESDREDGPHPGLAAGRISATDLTSSIQSPERNISTTSGLGGGTTTPQSNATANLMNQWKRYHMHHGGGGGGSSAGNHQQADQNSFSECTTEEHSDANF